MEKRNKIEDLVKVVYNGQQQPLQIIDNYEMLLGSLDKLIKAANIRVTEIMEITGLSESQYFRRRNDPNIWTPKELRPLIKLIQKKLIYKAN